MVAVTKLFISILLLLFYIPLNHLDIVESLFKSNHVTICFQKTNLFVRISPEFVLHINTTYLFNYQSFIFEFHHKK